jgi:hypothetical protein
MPVTLEASGTKGAAVTSGISRHQNVQPGESADSPLGSQVNMLIHPARENDHEDMIVAGDAIGT